jgi:hypothetical protein
MKLEPHAELLGQGTKLRGDLVPGNLESVKPKLETCQEDFNFEVGVLIRLQNITAVAENKAGDPRDQAFLVRAGN